MATLTLSSAFGFASDQDWAWEVTSSSASSLVISNGVYKQVFSGSFTYNDQGIVFGSVSSTSFYINNALVYLVSGMSSNATQLQVHANTAGDTQETYAYVLQSNDTIFGSSGNDDLLGYAGNDVIKGGLGNDTLNGGTGTDSAVFASNFAAASVQYSSATASFTVTTALDGADTLTNIETLVFADQSVSAASLISAPPATDDFAASVLTTGRLIVGGAVSGTLESAGDKDWLAVSLLAGQQYVFKLDTAATGGLPDPYLYLYDSGGQLLGSDDDGGSGLGSSLGFTATSSGTHYLSAESGIYGAGTGAYSLSAVLSSTAPASDTSAPTVSSYSPADGGTGIDLGANIVLTFNEAIQRGTGSIVLKTAAGVVVETYDSVTSSRVSVSGSTLTIDPSVSLVAATTYNLSFSAGTVLDLAGNRFAGTTSYDFSTRSVDEGTGAASTTIKLVSANAAGVVADLGTNSGSNTAPVLSADGRFVVFTSWGGNLVATDNNNPNETNNFNSDSFYKDMSSGAVQFVVTDEFGARSARMGSNSTILNPIPGGYPTGVSAVGEGYSMSANGRVVAFETWANNLVSLSYQGDPNSPTGGTINSTTITAGDNNTGYDVYAKNLTTGELKLVSSNVNGLSPGSMGGNVSSGAAVSADGSLVAFTSFNDGLVTGDTNRFSDIFVKTLASGAIARLSTTATGAQANGSSEQASFSADGRYLVFMSRATNLVSGDTNGAADIFRKDLQSGAIEWVSTSSAGAQTIVTPTNYAYSSDANVSANGRYIVFSSDAANLVADDTNGVRDVFYKDMVTGDLKRVAVNSSGVAATKINEQASISDDGRFVVFNSWDEDLVTLPFRHDYGPDVFIKDMLTGELRIVSEFAEDVSTYSLDGQISGNGQYVVMKSSYSPDQSLSGYQIYRLTNPFLAPREASASTTLSSTEAALTLTGSSNISGTGNALANTLIGNSGRNVLSGKGGDDSLDGGAGVDVAAYAGNRSSFTLTFDAGTVIVTDSSGAEGVDTLTNVERLQFADSTMALDTGGAGGQAYRVYQAAFNRTPDAGGLGFWINAMDSGATLKQVAEGFVNSAEFKAVYGTNPTNAQIVNKLYDNVLHRPGEIGGLNFWVGVLDAKAGTVAEVLAGFSESAENQAGLVGVIGNGFSFTPYSA